MPPSLTDIERKILDYMVLYLRTNTYQPSIREIGERFGVKSTKTVSEHLQALAEKGYLERDPSRSRGVKILGMDLSAQTISVPCYREIPDPLEGRLGTQPELHLAIDRRIAGATGSFFVAMRDDALLAVGAHRGDYLLVEPAELVDVASGDLLAVRLNGSASFCRFDRTADGVTLQPPRADKAATVVEDPDSLVLVGRVTALYHRMKAAPAPLSSVAH